jgi:hypothetical protein
MGLQKKKKETNCGLGLSTLRRSCSQKLSFDNSEPPLGRKEREKLRTTELEGEGDEHEEIGIKTRQ